MKLHISRSGRIGLIVACLVAACVSWSFAATQYATFSGPRYVPNEYIVTAQPGTDPAVVEQSVERLGASVVKPVAVSDTYLVRMGAGGGGVVRAMSSGVRTAAISPWVITGFTANSYCYKSDRIPDDPLFNQLWGMQMIHAPRAWDILTGSSGVTVAVLDTGVSNHPDLLGRIVAGYDFVQNDNDPSNDIDGHGTHVSGTIAAQGDNSEGVVGVCWDGVKIMPIRVLGDTGSGTLDWILSGLDYAMTHNVDVVNMSLGFGPGDIPLLQTKLKQLSTRGIILCAAAGNAYPPEEVGPPAKYDECICVASVGSTEAIAYYSCYGPGYEVDIAAPGGDDNQGLPGMILSTYVTWNGNVPTFGYQYEEGTSMACPHVAGAAALLLSAGIPPGEVRSRLQTTARRPQIGTMDKRKYGSGILDVAAALSNGSVQLTKPAKGAIVNGFPDIKANIRGIDPTSIAIYIDYGDGNGDGIPDNIATEVPILAGIPASAYLNAGQTAISFNYADVSLTGPLATGFHYIYITAKTKVGGEDVYDWGTFTVASKIIPAGQYLYAFPYGLTVTYPDGTTSATALPSDLLVDANTSAPLDFRLTSADRARLIRWNAAQSYYVQYVTGNNPRFPGENVPKDDDRAWLNPIVRMMLTNGTIQAVPTAGGFLPDDPLRSLQYPAGTGFWLILQKDAVISSQYTEISAPLGFSIYLYKGWNLIGNPYTYNVPLSAIHLKYQGEIRSFDEDQLSRRPWLDASIYGYVSGQGYVKVPQDKRLLEPFQGYWVRALVGGISPQDSLVMTVQ